MAGVFDQFTESSKAVVLAVWTLSGALLGLAFLFPDVGRSLTAGLLILATMVFIGSGLVYLSLLPVAADEQASV
ncbi:hypothetical protein BRC95_06220 [Halobacteriales archaeon QS_5_68_33]|jgi:hypothetical protein|nr:MAG: hypothetical protein BRC67_12850 [Halobacteriales archaeon QH_3_68_24]PSQ06034.1 MAG: hypothetical protein BRC95_06220 [Halobacteriales archaeon QS_5_68_33]